MDLKKFKKAMKKRGIDSSQIVEKTNLKRKHKALKHIFSVMDNQMEIESSDNEI